MDISLDEEDISSDIALYSLKFYDKENNIIKVIVSGGYTFPSSVFVIEGDVLANYIAFYGNVESEFIIEDFLDLDINYAKCEEQIKGGSLQYLSELIKNVLANGMSRKREDNKSN